MNANAEAMGGMPGSEPEAPLFVINLCASTTPVALVQPNSPELKRYTFFVTRRREEGRERFRLHMGYFETQAQADALLADVREVYPAAWVGPAPGPAQGQKPVLRGVPAAPVAVAVAPVAAVVAEVPAVAAVPAVVEAPAAPVELSLVEDVPRNAPPAAAVDHGPLEAMSNVREVLAELDGPAPPAPAPGIAELSPVQALSLLEEGPAKADLADTAIRMVTPEDTQTLRDIKLDTQNQAAPCFAVQLVWSVTPIDMTRLPQLAIFGAYTLYNVEGNRQGRRWYGVRLGFFSDAHAAKQVAYYMKGDYSAVVVVPVTVKERERASAPVEVAAPAPAPRKVAARVPTAQPVKPAPVVASKQPDMKGFELLPPDEQPTLESAKEPVAMAAMDDSQHHTVRLVGGAPEGAKVNRPGAAVTAVAAVPLKPRAAKKTGGKRVVARTQRRAEPGQALAREETLEMLGAGTLTLDEDKAQLDDSALRRPADVADKKPGLRFSRLLGRLGEKLGESRR